MRDDFQLRRILENPALWQILFVLIAGFTVLWIYISMRRSRRAMATDTDKNGYRDYRDEGHALRREETPEQMLTRVQRQNR